VITDGWSGYFGLDRLGYLHDRRSQRAAREDHEEETHDGVCWRQFGL
jgi:hypothetical protein